MKEMIGWDRDDLTHLDRRERKCAALWLKLGPQDVVGPPTGIIVGEMPGTGTSPLLPMFPYPPNSAGGRLLKMSGASPGTFLGKLMRINLMPTHTIIWDAREAGRRALQLHSLQPPKFRIVLCGKRVGTAFGHDEFYQIRERDDVWYTCIPHPSGKNLVYNDVDHRMHARIAIRWAMDERIV